MPDKISTFIEIILNIIRSIVSSLPLSFVTIGLLTMLIGAILNVGGIIVLGIFLLGIGAIVYLIELLRQ
mgnify:CR=1 FL=1